MGIIPNAQGQLTPLSVVEHACHSNSSKLVWLFLLSARMKMIKLKTKALDWSQHYSSIFKTLNASKLHCRWWDLAKNSSLFKLLWLSLLLARLKNNYFQKWRPYSSHNISPIIKSIAFFPYDQEQLPPPSLIPSCGNLNPFKILWLSLLPASVKKIHSKI